MDKNENSISFCVVLERTVINLFLVLDMELLLKISSAFPKIQYQVQYTWFCNAVTQSIAFVDRLDRVYQLSASGNCIHVTYRVSPRLF